MTLTPQSLQGLLLSRDLVLLSPPGVFLFPLERFPLFEEMVAAVGGYSQRSGLTWRVKLDSNIENNEKRTRTMFSLKISDIGFVSSLRKLNQFLYIVSCFDLTPHVLVRSMGLG